MACEHGLVCRQHGIDKPGQPGSHGESLALVDLALPVPESEHAHTHKGNPVPQLGITATLDVSHTFRADLLSPAASREPSFENAHVNTVAGGVMLTDVATLRNSATVAIINWTFAMPIDPTLPTTLLLLDYLPDGYCPPT